jgi:hypothetical protein
MTAMRYIFSPPLFDPLLAVESDWESWQPIDTTKANNSKQRGNITITPEKPSGHPPVNRITDGAAVQAWPSRSLPLCGEVSSTEFRK